MASSLTLPLDEAQVARRRIYRLALGVTLSLFFSQAINWPLSFIAPVLTMLILALPLPALSFKAGIKFVLALMVPVYAGAFLYVPFLEHARWSGVILITLALFGSFYYTARGGSPIMGMFMTMGLTLLITIGSVSIDALLVIMQSLWVGAISGVAFVWLAHAILPERVAVVAAQPSPAPPPEATPVSREIASRSAFRSLAVVMPLVIWFLFSSSSMAYVAIMIKVASMGQQASADTRREMGRSQIESTLWGGLAAMIAWQVMSIWPSLFMYGLVIAIAALLFGPRIFSGKGMTAEAGMWSYAFLTMIIILAPALLDGQSADGAGSAFYSRLILFIVIAVYGTLSVAIFDAFWPFKRVAETTVTLPAKDQHKTA